MTDFNPIGRSRDDIQAHAVAMIERRRAAGDRSTLLQMPTQTGKSRTAVKWIGRVMAERNARVLILADRGELLNQFGGELDQAGVAYAVEKADQRALPKMEAFPAVRVCLGSKDSYQDRKRTAPGGEQVTVSQRLSTWPRDYFTDVVQDECDLAVADTWRNINDHFAAFRLGLTATIDRLDGVPLATVFDSTAFCYPIADAIANGHRVPFRVVPLDVEINIRGIKPTRGGNFAAGELAARIGPKLEQLANVVAEHLDKRGVKKAVAFLPGGVVDGQACWLAYRFAEILAALGVPAKGVDGSHRDREAIVAGFRAGQTRVLCNTSLFGRGFSDPDIEAVIHLNPTTSRALYDQRSGRCGATRAGKEVGYLFHPCWETNPNLELVGPTDIFAGDADPKVRKLARKLAQLTPDADPQTIVEQARAVVADDERRERDRKLRLKVDRRHVRHRAWEFDPIGVASPWLPARPAPDAPGTTLRFDHAKALRDLGMKDLTGVSNATAPGLIAFWDERKRVGMSSLKQVNYLTNVRKLPLASVIDMTAVEASREIGRLHQAARPGAEAGGV